MACTLEYLVSINGSIQNLLLSWKGSKDIKSFSPPVAMRQTPYGPFSPPRCPRTLFLLLCNSISQYHHKNFLSKLPYTLPVYEVCVPYKLPQYPQGSPFLTTGCLWAQRHTVLYCMMHYHAQRSPYTLFHPTLPHNTNKHTQDSKSNDSNIPDASVGKVVDQTLVCASI